MIFWRASSARDAVDLTVLWRYLRFGDFGLGQVAVIPQYQHFPLPGWEVRQRPYDGLVLGREHGKALGRSGVHGVWRV